MPVKQKSSKSSAWKLSAASKAWQGNYQIIIDVAEKISGTVLQDPKLLMWNDQAVTRIGVIICWTKFCNILNLAYGNVYAHSKPEQLDQILRCAVMTRYLSAKRDPSFAARENEPSYRLQLYRISRRLIFRSLSQRSSYF